MLLAAIYAVCYAAIKAGLAFAPPLRFAGLRAVAAGAVLVPVVLLLGPPVLPPRRTWAGLFALAATGTILSYGAMFLSPGRTGAGIASVLGNTTPLIVMVLAAAFLGESITRSKATALGLGLAGAGLIAFPAISAPGRGGVWGVFLPLLAASGAAAEGVLAKRMRLARELVCVAAWQLLLGGAGLLLLSAWFEPGRTVEWGPRFIGLLLFLALVGTAGATTLWYWLVQQEEVSRLSLVLFLVPSAGSCWR